MSISPFKDGYGNFHFKHREKLHWSDRQNLQLPILFNSEDSSEELTDFTLFPFLRLPLDLRNQIYTLLIHPFRSMSTDSKIDISLDSLSPTDSTTTWRNYAFRSPCRLPCTPWWDGPKPQRISSDEYYTIWSLSCVSHQVREELGALFWQNVRLDIANYPLDMYDPFEDQPPSLLEQFLQEFPTAAQGIRELKFYIGYSKMSEIEAGDGKMVRLFESLAAHLNLEFMHVTLGFSALLIKQIVESNGDIAWIKAFRMIKPKKLRVTFLAAFNNWSEEAELAREQLHHKDEPWVFDGKVFDFLGTVRFIRELLSPANDEVMEEELYLKSRES